jgi:hypothetical protein
LRRRIAVDSPLVLAVPVLTVAADNPGIAQGELAAALEVERPRMEPVLDKLVGRGLTVRREDSATDAAGASTSPTPAKSFSPSCNTRSRCWRNE